MINIIEAEEKYYTCKYDRPFKEIMLNEKNEYLLIELLEYILKKEVQDIVINTVERNTGNLKVKRKTYDLLLTTNVGKIEIEVNARMEAHVHPRNMAYIADLYAHHTLLKEKYDEEVMIMQINLTYKIGKNKDPIKVYYVQDEKGEKYVKNLKIYEINMDYYLNLWENGSEEEKKKNRILIMLGLDRGKLEEFSKIDKVVEKYMKELDKLNSNPEFRLYMSAEEDERKIHNSRMYAAEKKGLEKGLEKGMKKGILQTAKNLINMNMSFEDISKATGLSLEEIASLSNKN